MLNIFAEIILIIIMIVVTILLYSFGKRILRLEIIIIEIVNELIISKYISKVSVDHLINLTNEISNINTIKESKNQTLN